MRHSTRNARIQRGAVAALLGALVLATSLGPVIAKKKKFLPYVVAPAVGDPKAPPVTDTVQIHRDGVSAEISYVTGVNRLRMMKATLDIDFDPFATPSDREPYFHTFLVTLENGSPRPLMFNPSTSRIVTSREQVAYAIDYTTLFQGVGRAANLSMDQLHQITYDRNATLRPGDKMRKLLVFEHWEGKWDGFVLGLSLEGDGLQGLSLSVPFRKHVLKPQKGAP